MRIAFVEIANFRKLKRVRIDLDKEKTLFVGANNSGKTSALVALRYFLYRKGGFRFGVNDLTICHHSRIRDIGDAWLANADLTEPQAPNLSDWASILPHLDVWIDAGKNELHYVGHLLPTIEWNGGELGVRLRVEPRDIQLLYRDFIETKKSAEKAKAEAKDKNGKPIEVKLWPSDLFDFLSQRFAKYFGIYFYILDPAKIKDPDKGIAYPQPLAVDVERFEGDPFDGLLQINEIPAQRGFSDGDSHDNDDRTDQRHTSRREAKRLAKQFSEYFYRHLDPNDKPNSVDIIALKAIEDAQKAYDSQLEISFEGPLKEMSGLGYPGVTDPRVKISTRLKPVDGLNHDAAVQYEVSTTNGAAMARLPEDYNGLGYQNLISMVFKLMSFRDAWMRVGKAKVSDENASSAVLPPIHLVLIEEPEAHLHVQVQQVFIRNAYDVLRKHKSLGSSKQFVTQLIVSTHSSHVAHEVEFSCIRYFRRYPANYLDNGGKPLSLVPISTVVNLTKAFGDQDETARFAKRYLRATHSDLFFADAAILIEGAAERILLPQFVRRQFQYLNECYITWLEVGGSHAHRLRPLIDHLGILTLIITDIDACDPGNHNRSARPAKGLGLKTSNKTLKDWLPNKEEIDALLALSPDDKKLDDGPLASVRVAYQMEIDVARKGERARLAPYTFEDSLVIQNLVISGKWSGTGLMGAFANIVNDASNLDELAQGLFEKLDGKKKAEFALDLLEMERSPADLECPSYIAEALDWLEKKLRSNKSEVIGLEAATQPAISSSAPIESKQQSSKAEQHENKAEVTGPENER